MADLIEIKAPTDQEGTLAILRSWLKHVGDHVDEHEPVAELETDKVAVEVAAPASGVVVELLGEIDAEIAPGAVLARLDPSAKAGAAPAKRDGAKAVATPRAARAAAPQDGERETRLSPAVRDLASQHGLDAATIEGTGRRGRVTRKDVLAFVETRGGGAPAAPAREEAAQEGAAKGRLVPLDRMRRQIAANMAKSVAVAPHVTALFEADFTAIIADRAKRKQAFADRGVNLTYTAYFVMACVAAIKAVPQVNSRLRADALEMFDDVNIAVGVALEDKGLVAPVIHKAQTLDLGGVAEKLQNLTVRAKDGKLAHADMRGGTFSISNHGVSGSLLAAPIIITQPQSAILGVGKLEKRAVVRKGAGGDEVVIRPMANITLTIDHRVLDGFQTNAFLTRFVEVIETWS